MKLRIPIPHETRAFIKDLYNKRCVICDSKKNLHIHHSDFDPSNNEIDNLLLVCGWCHALEFHPDNAGMIIKWMYKDR